MADLLYWQGHGKTLTINYREYTHPKAVDNRTGDEVVIDVMKKAGLRFKGE